MSNYETAMVPEHGQLGKVFIRRQFQDGSKSTTEWDGHVEVAHRDKVILNYNTGELRTIK